MAVVVDILKGREPDKGPEVVDFYSVDADVPVVKIPDGGGQIGIKDFLFSTAAGSGLGAYADEAGQGIAVGIEPCIDGLEVDILQIGAHFKGTEVAPYRIGVYINRHIVHGAAEIHLNIFEEDVIAAANAALFRLRADDIGRGLEIAFIGIDAPDVPNDEIFCGAVHLGAVVKEIHSGLNPQSLVGAVVGEPKGFAEHIFHRPEVHRGMLPVIHIEGHQIVPHLAPDVADHHILRISVEVQTVGIAFPEGDVFKNGTLDGTDLDGKSGGVSKFQVRKEEVLDIIKEHTGGYSVITPLGIVHSASSVAQPLPPGLLPAASQNGNIPVRLQIFGGKAGAVHGVLVAEHQDLAAGSLADDGTLFGPDDPVGGDDHGVVQIVGRFRGRDPQNGIFPKRRLEGLCPEGDALRAFFCQAAVGFNADSRRGRPEGGLDPLLYGGKVG